MRKWMLKKFGSVMQKQCKNNAANRCISKHAFIKKNKFSEKRETTQTITFMQ